MKLLFRASENEYSAFKFHEICDGHPNTITIIRNNFENIFGGYTNIPWSSNGENEKDEGKSFLFLLHSNNEHTECPKIWNYRLKEGDFPQCTREIHCNGAVGPTFGWGHDLCVVHRTNDQDSSCYPYTYLNVDDALTISGGSSNESNPMAKFRVIDYEVFEII